MLRLIPFSVKYGTGFATCIYTVHLIDFESGSERIHRTLLRGKQANGENCYSLWIEASPQFTAESFNDLQPLFYG